MSNISAGPVSMQLPSLRLLLAATCKATTNEPNHKDHEAHKGRTKTFVGTFDPLSILYPVTIP